MHNHSRGKCSALEIEMPGNKLALGLVDLGGWA
jgi:hypothetical protein